MPRGFPFAAPRTARRLAASAFVRPQKIPPRTSHGPHVIRTPLHQVRQRRARVEHRTHDSHDAPLHRRRTLVEHRQIIAMVVKHLRRRSLRQTPPAEVINPAPGLDPHPVTGQLHPPAEVDLLHVGEKNPRRNRPSPEILRPGSRKQRRSPKKHRGHRRTALRPVRHTAKYDLGRKDTPGSR